MFSAFVRKVNRFRKVADRVLLVTDMSIYKLDATKFKAMKKPWPIREVSQGTDVRVSAVCVSVDVEA